MIQELERLEKRLRSTQASLDACSARLVELEAHKDRAIVLLVKHSWDAQEVREFVDKISPIDRPAVVLAEFAEKS